MNQTHTRKLRDREGGGGGGGETEGRVNWGREEGWGWAERGEQKGAGRYLETR